MSDIKVTVVDGNNVNLLVTPTARTVVNVDRGQYGPTGSAGPTGPTGPQGQGITIKGTVATVGGDAQLSSTALIATNSQDIKYFAITLPSG